MAIISKSIIYITLIASFFTSNALLAKDLGVIGKIYEITETDFLDFVQMKLRHMERTGKIDALQQKMANLARERANRPPKVAGITKAVVTKTWDFDPTHTVTQDVITPSGVIVKAGTKINPLDTVQLRQELFFYDADDAKQVNWVTQKLKQLNGRGKLILVNGAIADQSKLFNRPIYFDQSGALTSKFNIVHVPAFVAQNGKLLKITEVKI